MRARVTNAVLAGVSVLSALALAACAAADPDEARPAASPKPGVPVTIAFAGDVHFAGMLANRLDNPSTAMGPLTAVLTSADLAVLNLETSVTTRGTPQAKQFTFRAGPDAFRALTSAGIDVVSMANNHALDYGPSSVPDALAAASTAGMPVIGLGEDDRHAYAPWVATVKQQRIAFLAASAVLDDSLVSSWSAGPGKPGVATALDGHNEALVKAVQEIRPQVDTVVVELHYGKDLTTCPTAVQRSLATQLVAAGADVVVGQHAHVLLGGGYLGSSYVHYGMGNFEFYASKGGATTETGVLVLTVAGRTVSDPTWHPGRIVDGLPTPLGGAEGDAATARWESLRGCAGLSATPTTSG